jgi:hypothetical protein
MNRFNPGKKELLTLGLLLVLGAAAGVVLLLAPPGSPQSKWLPKCMFHEWTGLHCPGCGATRAFSALLHGDLKSSLRNNLLLIPGGLMLALMVVKPNLSLKRPVAVAIAATVIGFAVLRNLPFAPFAWLAPIPLRNNAEQTSEEPGAEDRCKPDQDQRGGQQEKPEPAERQSALG